MKLSLLDASGKVVETCEHDQEVFIAIRDRAYQAGEKFKLELAETEQNNFVWVQLDETLSPSLIYVTEKIWEYSVIIADNLKKAYSPKAFTGDHHYIRIWKPSELELHYRNLALNPHDQKEPSGAYPHAYANVETRDDATFFARNAIDGMIANHHHGSFPYQSWGINKQADAAITIDFGRFVVIDKINLVLRADYPHDSFWTSVTVKFDNDEMELSTTNSPDRQSFAFKPIKTKQVTVTDLIKNEDDSPFPALTEIEIFGTEA